MSHQSRAVQLNLIAMDTTINDNISWRSYAGFLKIVSGSGLETNFFCRGWGGRKGGERVDGPVKRQIFPPPAAA